MKQRLMKDCRADTVSVGPPGSLLEPENSEG